MFNSNRNNNIQKDYDMIRLKEDNQRLNLQVIQMTNQYYNAQKDANFYQNQYENLKKAVETFCKSCLSNDYNTAQLGGNNILRNLDTLQLIDFTKSDFLKQKNNQLSLIKRLKEENVFLMNRVNQLQNSLDNALAMNSFSEEQTYEVEEEKDNTNDEPVVLNVDRSNIPNSNTYSYNIQNTPPPKKEYKPQDNAQKVVTPVQKKNIDNSLPQMNVSAIPQTNNPTQAQQSNIKYVATNVETIMKTLGTPDNAVIHAIGKNGFSESTDIINWVYENYESLNNKRSTVLNSLSNLAKAQVLSKEEISTGLRTVKLYKLSNIGKQIYNEQFKEVPARPECEKIESDHDNLKHGYNIKDCCTQLAKYFDCSSLEMQRDKISFKLPNGETYIPDIVATLKNGKKIYVEVELGNTEATKDKMDNDFYKKCDKMFQVTKTFFIVSDNAETKKDNDRKISNWIVKNGGKGSKTLKGLVVYSVTIRDFQKGQDNIFKKPYMEI